MYIYLLYTHVKCILCVRTYVYIYLNLYIRRILVYRTFISIIKHYRMSDFYGNCCNLYSRTRRSKIIPVRKIFTSKRLCCLNSLSQGMLCTFLDFRIVEYLFTTYSHTVLPSYVHFIVTFCHEVSIRSQLMKQSFEVVLLSHFFLQSQHISLFLVSLFSLKNYRPSLRGQTVIVE